MRPSPLNPMPTLRTRQNQATAAKDRLQPALLDRLTDNEPHLRTERPDAVFVNESRLREALLRHRWNKTRTAAQLGITFRALRYKLKKLGME